MIHIKPFRLFTESLSGGKILYHGSSKVITTFNPMSFFAETPQFAIDYADQKSIDYGNDDDTILYTVQLSSDCSVFDINDSKACASLEAILPAEIKYVYNDFGFNATESKAEYILNMKGYYTNEPAMAFDRVAIGDRIPNPEYKSEFYVVYDIDKEYVYTYSETTFEHEKGRSTKKGNPTYKPVYDFIESYIKAETGQTYVYEDDIKAYVYAFTHRDGRYYGIPTPSTELVAEFERINKEFEQRIVDMLISKKYITKFNRETEIRKLADSWRYYENDTIVTALKKLGYDGYVALERNTKTYAIFNPALHVKILDRK
jgi:hypothetical protein